MIHLGVVVNKTLDHRSKRLHFFTEPGQPRKKERKKEKERERERQRQRERERFLSGPPTFKENLVVSPYKEKEAEIISGEREDLPVLFHNPAACQRLKTSG